MQDRGRRDSPPARDARGILIQYAPITERVVAALPRLGIVSRIGAGYDTDRHHGLREARRLGGELARLRRRRGRHPRARAIACAGAQRGRVASRRHRRALALPVAGPVSARLRPDTGHRRPRPHRQAHGPRVAQRVPARRRLRSVPDRRRLPRLRRARHARRCIRTRGLVTLHVPLNDETRGMIGAKRWA